MTTKGFILGFGIGLFVVFWTGFAHEKELELRDAHEMRMHKQILKRILKIQTLRENLAEEREATLSWIRWSESCADQDERDRKYEDQFEIMLAACSKSVEEHGCF